MKHQAAKWFITIAIILYFEASYCQNKDLVHDHQDSILYKIDEINSRLDRLTEKSVRAGISIAYRKIGNHYASSYQSASISPIDSTLKLEDLDRDAFILSTSIVISPFVKAKWLDEIILQNDKNLRFWRQRNLELKENQLMGKDSSSAYKKRNLWGLALTKTLLYLVQNIGLTANVNLLEVSQAQKELSFNKSLEGGIGFCLRLSSSIYFSYANELLFSHQLRESVKLKANERIYKDGSLITSIDQIEQDDKNFYITKNVIGHAFRVIIVF